MSAQDAQDIVQMNSLGGDVPIVSGEKKKGGLLWVVLGCVVVGVGLGVFVYQQSLKPAVKPSPTPKAVVVKPSPLSETTPTPIASPITPDTNEVKPVANTITFPKSGKIRVYSTLSNSQLVLKVTTNGTTKTITLPSKSITAATPMNYGDSTFVVEGGSSATIDAHLNSATGAKLAGWIVPSDTLKSKCSANNSGVADFTNQLNYVTSNLAGEAIFGWQCWEDDDVPGEFNDLYLLWTYVPGSSVSSPTPTPSASVKPSPTPTPSPSIKPSPSPSIKPSPSPSVAASAVVTVATPTPSPRAAMPDTSEGVPVTGVFEVTVGTISVGLILLVLGFVGLITL